MDDAYTHTRLESVIYSFITHTYHTFNHTIDRIANVGPCSPSSTGNGVTLTVTECSPLAIIKSYLIITAFSSPKSHGIKLPNDRRYMGLEPVYPEMYSIPGSIR